MLEEAHRASAITQSVGPDPTWAGVAYSMVARCARALLGIEPATSPVAWYDETFPIGDEDHEPVVRSGLVELFTSDGAESLGVQPRLEAAVRALEFALREAARTSVGPLLVAFEQLHRADSASVRVLSVLVARAPEVPACLVFTHTPRFQGVHAHREAVTLRGISRAQAREVAASARPGHDPDDVLAHLPAEVLPLHLEQLLRWHVEGGGVAPERLVDVIATRLERLSMKARRVLQALAVLGEEAPATVARVVGSGGDLSTVRMLAERGWIAIENHDLDQFLSISHPLLREVVDASTPSTLRKELHLACLAATDDREMPLEVQALHAEHTNDAFSTLLLLERLGDRSLARGDDTAAAQALRRGLEFSRREFALGDTDSEGAIVIFTRKLGEALVRARDFAEAEGVLREGLAVATRGTVEWARLEGILGRALCSRGRQAEGLRAIDNAVVVASRHGAASLVSDLLVSRADMEAVVRDYRDAVRSVEAADARLVEALRLTPSNGPLLRQRAELLVRLARARRLAELDAERALADARALAETLGLALLLARCDEEGAERAEFTGDRRGAVRLWGSAAQRAREAGDAGLEAAYHERARLLTRVEVHPQRSPVVPR
jgi:serine/threonine-protein kinase